jgi:isoleucyl-tRNA synthetase
MSESKNNYKETLNLPQTAFPMKADLVRKEPEILKRWQETHLGQAVLRKNSGRPKFILHDGPPYANGSIHFGHILNKILKDVIVKFKSMTGHQAPFVPGWDCHGLPIEHQVDRDLGPRKKKMGKIEIRKACREYAMKFVNIQREEFKRLGVLGDWDHPYLTMSGGYEATIAREFGRFVAEGNVYKGLRPVLWCPHCQTALAEAEVEYEEHESPSVYVRFPLQGDFGDIFPKLAGQKISIVIWTTTPWTLPANLAVALHENYDYVVIPYPSSAGGPAASEFFLIAKQRLTSFSEMLGIEEPEPLYRLSGKKLENRPCRHPFLARDSKIVLSDHVSMDTGTGCVHIAPGHGEEDYHVGRVYGLKTLTPVDHEGRFTEEVGMEQWKGLKVLEANPKILEELRRSGNLLRDERIRHMYPHCWRCKNPVIFRATEQWFLSLEKNHLRVKALDAIRRIQWIPPWGRERIYGMVEKRPDWCLSRQRSWGVPIVAFRCRKCNYLHLDSRLIGEIANRFEKDGSDLWFAEPPEKLLPPGFVCPECKGTEWAKEEDILDVWFDSGVSFAAVLEKNRELAFPADLYLEGSDQHRGWFHSSLLASIGTRGKSPYKTVLTHGFVVDSEGKKYSKSAGNYIPPDKILKENGAEILRLWVAAEDYRNDIRVSQEILNRLVEAYRKIRNTCRFLLGNLSDYDPDTMKQTARYQEIDKWALHHLQKLILRIKKAYEEYNFHIIFHELNRFCTVDLSAFYLDILKDRLYTYARNHPERRGAQAVLFDLAATLAPMMAPILSFTAEEIWQHIPRFRGKEDSVHLADFPEAHLEWINEALAARWEDFRQVRDELLKALEKARREKVIGQSLEARLIVTADGAPQTLLESFGSSLRDLVQVSRIEWGAEIPPEAFRSEKFPSLFVEVKKAEGKKCERCWVWSPAVGTFPDHPALCERCHEVIKSL